MAVGEGDLADRDRLVADAAGGEGRVGVGHLQRRDAEPQTAERLGREAVELGLDPHVVGGLGDRLGAEVERELGVDGVVGGERRLVQADRCRRSCRSRSRPPSARTRGRRGRAASRCSRSCRGRSPRRIAVVSAKVLKAEPGWRWPWAARLNCWSLVAAARGHRPDEAVVGVDRDDRGGGVVGVAEVAVDRGAPGLLELGVDRRVDLEAALADGVDAVLLDQLLLDEVEEVGLADLGVAWLPGLSSIGSSSASSASSSLM